MIRLRPFEKMSYKEIRDKYLELLVEKEAVEFDKADIIRNGPSKPGRKTEESYKILEKFPKLREYLYHDNKKIKKENLRKILIGPDEAPRSLGGEGEFTTMRSVFDKIISEIDGDASDISPDAVDACKKIFKYKRLNVVGKGVSKSPTFQETLDSSDTSEPLAYWLQSQLSVKVCPYCNRMYTTTLYGKKRVRPDFDHFYPQSRYPYLAVSLFNLIPSCNVCNRAKSDYAEIKKYFEKKGKSKKVIHRREQKSIIYPYDESYNESYNELKRHISFRVKPNETYQEVLMGQSDDFTVELRPTEYPGKLEFEKSTLTKTELDERFGYVKSKLGDDEKEERAFWDRAKDSIDLLRLESLYNEHKSEIRKILRIHYEYNQDAIQLIMQTLDTPTAAHMDLLFDRDLQYFASLRPEEWGNSPLNKLKSDIIDQLDKLKNIGTRPIWIGSNENDK